MKRKFLEDLFKDLELEDSARKTLVDTIMNANGEDINAEKEKMEVIKNDLKVKESLVDELNKKIKENADIDIEAIKKEQYDLGLAEGSKEVEEFKKTATLKNAIKNAKDFDLVFSKLNKDKLNYVKSDDGNYTVEGLDDQLKEIQEKYSYLFNEEKPEPKKIDLGGNHEEKPGEDNSLARKVMGLS